MQDLEETLASMHKHVSNTSRNKKEAARRRYEKKNGVQAVSFEFGKFVVSGNAFRRESKH